MAKNDMLSELSEVVRLQHEFDRAQTGGFDKKEEAAIREETAAANFLRAHHAELEAMARDCQGEREVVWEIWQDDMIVANSDSLQDANHYMMMYSQDGPVELKRVVAYRKAIDDAMRAENSHD